jgi:transglutaminase-like putative cysteine protease
VVENITYDKELASTVQIGYLPDVDRVLARRKGICFDYAALMASMLRSQGVPTKMVAGFVGEVYHAWLDVYSPETGWINAAIFFDGKSWQLMDPTFAAGANQSDDIMRFIGDGTNYKAKFTY